MAIKYWENLLEKDIAFAINDDKKLRDEYNQSQIHTCHFDKSWTKAGIEQGLNKVNEKLRRKNKPEIVITANRIGRAVTLFHKEIKNARGKTVSMAGVDTKDLNAPVFPKRDFVAGRKTSKPGRVFIAEETKIVADNAGTVLKIIKNAKTKVTKYLVKKVGEDARGVMQNSGLEFAHGEFGSKSSLGALELGKRALTKANSQDGLEELQNTFETDGVKANEFIRQYGIASLKDYIRDTLQIKIGINESEVGDKATFNDSFTVEAAFKIQDKNFAKHYDMPGIRKTYSEAVKKAFNKIRDKKISNLQYESSPKGIVRAKNATTRQMELSFLKFLKKNPQFAVLSTAKPLKKSNKKTRKVVNNEGKGKQTVRKGTKAKGGLAKVATGAQQGLSPISLRNLINAMLPDELLKQMGSPRLNNRTGRFRNSAKVTNVTLGNIGGVNIDYTYQLDPYQTFEPGGARGSTNRDPRSLIGLSIREIATEIIGKKLIKTRRV